MLAPDVPIEEERKATYNAQHFYPVKLGQIFDDAYQVIAKLGYGGSSTVWLAKDVHRYVSVVTKLASCIVILCRRVWQSTRYVALKICNNDHANATSASHELQISRHITTTNPSHPGRQFVRTVLESFEIRGPYGNHMCLVYEPMREPIWLLQRRFPDDRYPSDLLKWTLKYVLSGLDYLHSECHVIHTGEFVVIMLTVVPRLAKLKDIKPENILVGLESASVLHDVANAEAEEPSPRKVLGDRTIYLSRNNFGVPKSSPGKPVLTDFDTATLGNVSHPLTHPIQPNPYRSPEVTLGAPWTYSADIWNLGLMVRLSKFATGETQLMSMRGQIWNLLEDKTLCDGFDPEHQQYSSRAHLAQLIGFIGHPPKALLDQGQLTTRWFSSDGKSHRQYVQTTC